MLSVPVLETDRLRMRGHRVSDYDQCCALWGDPQVVHHIRPKPFTPEEVWSRMLRHAGHWALLGFGSWVVEEKASGRFVGEVGFLDYHRDIQPPLLTTPEIGWVLAPHAHGKGYATEAVNAALNWGDRHFGPVRTSCIITPNNSASIRVANKCGFCQLQPVSYGGESILLFVRDSPEQR
jgi:RimJ/RimL family protein N-acetyltransferase